MNSFVSNKWGRLVVIHLGKGEKLLESIQAEVDRLGIRNGVVLSAIGSMRKASLHIIMNTEDNSENKYITVEKPIELGGVQGVILDGEPHLHIICADPERPYIGHLENGTEVQYLAEISIAEILDLDVTRKLDEFGISYITEK
ncbi:Predicted DNA-binding protein with PD1-like DNA-binding motif [uncultured Ruminococcus sp.]|uniref:DNA-binding protein n=1 Tax=Massiliimalia timonensis TaxID=1987501 RepID=A0A8J6TTK9_9FIRM|nr:PPC domain-containing DNA-binding protein [Massiliimalia timonensis]MBC8609913.1 DNA-binding protein [Massiliimalia timonensis]MBS7175698.1 DNA-binding protein [Clostridiales bacterium]SCH19593.1 Predicted DNA-binding protein with PD1-like DNA-binding motif [uncultured Ruminococcus sp.]SCH25465.1 Predicted DNA-binding protein with PD1-like DNA-binding motif [uncultured Clostridium sp.]